MCNPPWLNTSFVFSQTDLENGIYDPDHIFLESCFNFAKIHLNRTNPDARMLLIFSDYGNILNINEPDAIEKLTNKYKLRITSIKTTRWDTKISDNNDPLKNFKKDSKVILYDIRRI